MSVVDRLYCVCERVVEGESKVIPRYVANIVIQHGKKIFDEKKREEIIKECESKQKQLHKRFWSELKEDVDKYQHELNEFTFWSITLPNSLDDYKGFCSAVQWNSRGFDPKITMEEGKMLLESYGTTQLREYVEKKKIEAIVKFPKAQKNYEETLDEMKQIGREVKEVKKSIEVIKNFEALIESLKNESFDQNLSNRFIERMYLARNGVRLKVG